VLYLLLSLYALYIMYLEGIGAMHNNYLTHSGCLNDY
jgi:hypothetical protein